MNECIFCKIIAGQIPGGIVYRDKQVIAIKDINPLSPVHLLIIPLEHIASLQDVTEANSGLLAHMMMVAKNLAGENGIAVKGYRLVINTGPEGGQAVKHLHLHLLGGKMLDGKLG